MFFRLLLYLIVTILGVRFVRSLFNKPPLNEEVKGQPKNKPIDYKNSDIEDAEFEDLEP